MADFFQDGTRKALTERGRPRPRERLPNERSSEGWNERNRPNWIGFSHLLFVNRSFTPQDCRLRCNIS